MPAPSELQGIPPARRASYAEADLVKDGAGYFASLPHFNVAPQGSQAVFSPDFGPGAASSAQLGAALYLFNAAGYDRQAQLRTVWSEPPDAVQDLWYGLANWDTDRWDWFQSPADYKLLLDSFDPYINFAGSLVLAIVRTGTDPSTLDSLRLAAPLPTAALSSDVVQGPPQLSVNFDAAASSAAEGSIVKYEFDKGNGVVVDRGTDPTFSTIYTNAGPHDATVTVTDSQGGTATAKLRIRVTPAWTHTYSRGGADAVYGLTVDGDGNIYACGVSSPFGQPSPAVVWKFDPYGNLLWARGSGGMLYGSFNRVTLDIEGNLVLCGQESVSGGSRAILQKWTPEGQPLWTRAFQGSQSAGLAEAVCYGTEIYAAGYRDDTLDDTQLVALRVAGDGSLVWARKWTYGAGNSCQAYCCSIRANELLGSLEFLAAGFGGPADWEVPTFEPSPLLVGWDADGNLLRSWRIGDGSYNGYIYSLRATGNSPFSNRIVALGSQWGGSEYQQYLLVSKLNGSNDGGVLYGQVGYSIESKDLCFSPNATGWLTAGGVTISSVGYGSLVAMDPGSGSASAQYCWDASGSGQTSYRAVRPTAGGGVVLGGSAQSIPLPGTRGELSGASAGYANAWGDVTGEESAYTLYWEDTGLITIPITDGVIDGPQSATSALVRYDPLVHP